uniref:Uncharacterized protein n=1 Tax=viral metagenome TaxID=1070528 RepID=A0A6M3JU44_9ZZZZ
MKDETKVIARFGISVLSDGNVNISGPIKEPIFVLDVFGRAMSAVANFIVQEKQKSIIEPAKPSIIIPG